MVVLYCMTDGTPEEILKRIFRVFDLNSDGSITIDEMRAIVKSMFDLLRPKKIIRISLVAAHG